MGVEGVEMVTISEAQRRLGLSRQTWLRRRKALGIRSYGYSVNWIDVLRAFTNEPNNEERKSECAFYQTTINPPPTPEAI